MALPEAVKNVGNRLLHNTRSEVLHLFQPTATTMRFLLILVLAKP
jgi:hypothetical protein